MTLENKTSALKELCDRRDAQAALLASQVKQIGEAPETCTDFPQAAFVEYARLNTAEALYAAKLRGLDRKTVLLGVAYAAAGALYGVMFEKSHLFTESEVDAQDAVRVAAEAAYDASEAEYTRLRSADGTEAN